MTGYAKVQAALGDRKLYIEIKTLNSKQLDLIVKLPAILRIRELDIRTMLGQLERGKMELTVTEETTADGGNLNEELLVSRYEALKRVANQLGASDATLLSSLVTMPDLWNTTDNSELSDEAWDSFKQSLQQAIELTDHFRADEGAVLERDFHKHIDLIEQKLNEIPSYESERIDTAKERIRRYMADAAIKDIDENRFEQELIYYLEKLDITEEKVRLQKHIDYFRQTMADETVCGKKLGFVAQEMGREINTTGSKANHVEIQKLVVVMKDELEKIKEQLGNVL
jgi:uncharacterized protein (TIGR00255 family)